MRFALPLTLGLVLIPVSPSLTHAQQTLQVAASLGSTSVRDDMLIPLAFTGPGFGLGARYALAPGPHRIDAELALGIGVLQSRFGQPAEQLSHGLAVAYRRAITGAFEAGAVIRWHDEMSYIESWDDAHGYWLSQFGVGVSVRDRRDLGTWITLDTRAEVTLLGLASRPAMGRTNKQDALTHVSFHLDRIADHPTVVSIADLQAARIESIARFGRRRSGLGIGLSASFARAADPVPYTLFVVQAICAFAWEL